MSGLKLTWIITLLALVIGEAQGQILVNHDVVTTSFLQDDEEDGWDEEDESGFSITLNLGAYFANKKSAQAYNGSGIVIDGEEYQFVFEDDGSGIRYFRIDERLNQDMFPTQTQSVLDAVGATGLIIPDDSNPANMSYQPAFVIGVNLKYNFSNTAAVVLDLNTTRLKAVDVFTIQFIGTGQQQNAQNDVRPYTITGEEQRIFISLGYRQGWELKGKNKVYCDFFGDMLMTQLRSNYLTVPSGSAGTGSTGFNDLQLITYSRANNAIAPGQYNPKAGVGFGFGIGPGVEFVLKEKIRMDLGLIISRDKVKIEQYGDNMINYQVVARFGI